MKIVTEKNQTMRKLTASILSGILLGLSVPNFSPVPLGFLAWFWLVPILLEFKQTETFKSFLLQSFIAVCLGFSIITLWVVNASVIILFGVGLIGSLPWLVCPLFGWFGNGFIMLLSFRLEQSGWVLPRKRKCFI
jgi:apolipoprotein N-acyltransferase